jgi:hypothetical protein
MTAASERLTKDQSPTECGSSRIVGSIQVMQVADAIEIGSVFSNSDFGIFRDGLNKLGKLAAYSRFQQHSYRALERELVVERERRTFANEQEIEAVINNASIGCAVVYTNNSYPEWLIVPKFVRQPNVFDPNFGPMSREKFGSGKLELIVASLPKPVGGLFERERKARDEDSGNSGYQRAEYVET